MDLYTLTKDFKKKDIIENFQSMIWTERYYGDSEVEVNFPLNEINDVIDRIPLNSFLSINQSNEIMIVETIDVKDGDSIKVQGTSILAWLNNRFIRTSNNHSDQVWELGNIPAGAILWFIVKEMCTDTSSYLNGSIDIGILDEYLSMLVVPGLGLHNYDASGEDVTIGIKYGPVYDTLREIAVAYEIGIQILLEQDPDSPYPLGFRSYRGVNHTTEQDDVPVVRFSPFWDSLTDVDELRSIAPQKTIVFAFGTNVDDPFESCGVAYLPKPRSGFDVRAEQTFVEDFDPDVPDTDVVSALSIQAEIELYNNKEIVAIDGEVIPIPFQYKRDYSLGDLIELQGKSKYINKARVVEYIRIQDQTGERGYPTFAAIGDILVPKPAPVPEPPPPPPPTVTWVDLGPTTHPSARSLAGMAYDPGIDKVLLWNGYNFGHPGGSTLRDTQLYDFATNNWTNAAPVHRPGNAIDPSFAGASGWPATAWDGIRVINIGGSNYGTSNPGHGANRVAGYSSGDWSNTLYFADLITMIIRPDLIYNVGPYLLAIGAWEPYPSLVDHNYIYKWDPSALTFTQIFPSVIVQPTSGGHAGIAVNGSDVYYYGGIQGGGTTQYLLKWNFTTEDWDTVTTAHSPPNGRGSFVFLYDALSDSYILFGGVIAGTERNDTWQFKVSTGDWTELTSTLVTSPSARFSMSGASTPDGILVFGGDDGSAYSSETWTLQLT
jgi:Siphovirus ReqiPepy6 Gp37-like protein